MIPQMAALAAATLVSEDLACIGAGVLVAQGHLGFWESTIACFFGIVSGDFLLYLSGKLGAVQALRWNWLRRRISSPEVEQAREWLRRRGLLVVLISRFTPGLRLPVYLAAGIVSAPLWSFAAALLGAAALWTPLLVGGSALLGAEAIKAALADATTFLTVVAFILAAVYFSRRSKYARWEFLPTWAAYLPLAPWVLYQAIRHRSLTACLAANPGIPLSGFAGESKSAILRHLRTGGAPVPCFDVIPSSLPSSVRVERAAAFMQEHGIPFPVVLKPDVGERGDGVAIVKTHQDLALRLSAAAEDTIIQAYAAGIEFGVYYFRRPKEAKGHVPSITEKRFPAVTGDGNSTLRQLILNDERASLLSDVYFSRTSQPLESVPAHGETVQLVEIGSHCKGAVFLDGTQLRTSALEAAIDRIAQAHPGFHLGRFDLRAPSRDSLCAGEGLQVLELNGITAEPTHIYDPAVNLWDAYWALFQHWRMAYEIGAENIARGASRTSFASFLRAVRAHLRGSGQEAGPETCSSGEPFPA